MTETLIRGSARIDEMRSEINFITTMLFGLARNKDRSIHRDTIKETIKGTGPFEHTGCYFIARFGDFDVDGCVWDLFWRGSGYDKFYVHCLAKNGVGEICFAGGHDDDAYKYQKLGLPGVFIAHKGLEVFVQGMIAEFSLEVALGPFIQAAAQA